jgi:hypothetical protein
VGHGPPSQGASPVSGVGTTLTAKAGAAAAAGIGAGAAAGAIQTSGPGRGLIPGLVAFELLKQRFPATTLRHPAKYSPIGGVSSTSSVLMRIARQFASHGVIHTRGICTLQNKVTVELTDFSSFQCMLLQCFSCYDHLTTEYGREKMAAMTNKLHSKVAQV